jgi:hypothetical protein
MTTKEQARAAAPELADWVDEVRQVFPGAKVTYLCIPAIGLEVGVKPEPQTHQWADSTTAAETRKLTERQQKEAIEAHKRRQGKHGAKVTRAKLNK